MRRHDHGWTSIDPGGVTDEPNPTGRARRLSLHALLRYLQRYVYPERGELTSARDYTPEEMQKARLILIQHIREAEFVEREKGTSQRIWQMKNGIRFVVLDDLVKTVLSENPKGYRK